MRAENKTSFSPSFILLHKKMIEQMTVTPMNTEDMMSKVFELEDSA
jgi:hypothetical protein